MIFPDVKKNTGDFQGSKAVNFQGFWRPLRKLELFPVPFGETTHRFSDFPIYEVSKGEKSHSHRIYVWHIYLHLP